MPADLATSHLHRCQGCGTVWGHGNMMQADIEAHKCPKCGKAEWRIYRGGGQPTNVTPIRPGVAQPWWLTLFYGAAVVSMLFAVGYFALCFWHEWKVKA